MRRIKSKTPASPRANPRKSRSESRATDKNPHQGRGEVRIIGGQMRGRKIRFDAAEGLRPTIDRIRETLFNWLARDIGNSNCLDLFAGSGALGFEAASRGASNVTLVEQNATVAKCLKQNCEMLNVDSVRVINQNAELFLTQTTEKFDLVFLDPPFAKKLLPATLVKLTSCLADNALMYIEQEQSTDIFIPGEPWQQLKLKSSGSFNYGLYRRHVTPAS